MATTLLQAVNRVLKLHRFSTVASIESNDLLAVSVREAIQEGIRQITETEDFDFMRRNDGFLKTRAKVAATTTLSVTNDSTTFTITSYSGAIGDITGNFTGRLIVTGDSGQGNTAYRIASMTLSGGTITGTLANAFLGTTNAAQAGRIVYYEYGLPTSVRTVLSAKHEETPLRVKFSPPGDVWDEVVTRHWETEDDNPETIIVSGILDPTFDGSGSQPDPMTRLMVWPTPENGEQVIEYTYKRRLELSADADEFEGIPGSIIGEIVNYAYGYTLFGSIASDPVTGQDWMNRALVRARAFRSGTEPDHGRRRRLRSIDEIHSGGDHPEIFGRLPSEVG